MNLREKITLRNIKCQLQELQAESGQPLASASSSSPGVVDNTSLQELGGKDKSINLVRIGVGASNNTSSTVLGGSSALGVATTASVNNTAIGAATLAKTTSGGHNTAVGNSALINNTTGERNSSVGTQSGYANSTGKGNSYLGNLAAYDNGLGSYNVALGYRTMAIASTGYVNGGSTINMNNNVFIGSSIMPSAAVSDTLAIDNKGVTTTLPANALIYGGFSAANRFIKINGAFSINPANIPNAAGNATFTKVIVAKDTGEFGWEPKSVNYTTLNTAKLSYYSGNNLTNGATAPALINTIIGGSGSVKDLTTISGQENTLITYSDSIALTSGTGNIMMGYLSGTTITTGSYNTFLGRRAGKNIITGSNNIIIGNNGTTSNVEFATNLTNYVQILSGLPSITPANNNLNIGNWIFGNNGNIGINVTTPTHKFEVKGTVKLTGIGTVTTGTSLYIKDAAGRMKEISISDLKTLLGIKK